MPPGVGAKLPVSYAAQGAPVAATFGSVAFEYDPPAVTPRPLLPFPFLSRKH